MCGGPVKQAGRVLRYHGIQEKGGGSYLEVRPLSRHLLEDAHEDVGGQRALVSLVQDDDAVALQQGVVHGLPEQHAVGHVPGRGRRKHSHAAVQPVVLNPVLGGTPVLHV